MKIQIVTEDKFFDQVAELFFKLGNESIKKTGRFVISLAGGSTPQRLYELLVRPEFRNRIDWNSVFFFFGDERDVSPISAKSNYRLANEHLLAPLGIHKENIFRWQTEIINADEVALNYEKAIRKFFDIGLNDFPRFDLIFLGMGDDGHTASLFPFTEALSESKRIAVSNYVEKLDTNRLTLTFPAINSAANIVFTVTGGGKAETLREVLEGEKIPEKFPSQRIDPVRGRLFWMIDSAAGEKLSS